MSELESFEYIQRQLLVSDANVDLDYALVDIQQAPEGKEAFEQSFDFVQDQYYDGLQRLADMQRKLGVNVTHVENPNDVAGLSNYSRQAIVENALHSVAASPILHFKEKLELTDRWVKYTSGRRKTFDTKTQSRIFAIDSLSRYGTELDIKDARDISVELSQRPFVRGTKEVQSRLGWLATK